MRGTIFNREAETKKPSKLTLHHAETSDIKLI